MNKSKQNVAIGVAIGLLAGLVFGIAFGPSENNIGTSGAQNARGNILNLSRIQDGADEAGNYEEPGSADTLSLTATDADGKEMKIIVIK